MTETTQQAAAGQSSAATARGAWLDWRDRKDRPLYSARLWPNRSLGPRGHRRVLQLAAAGLGLPMLALAGTTVFWGLVPFAAAALGGLWFGFRRNNFDGRLTEEVKVWRDEIRIERREPNGRVHRWSANPAQVRIRLQEVAKVEQYLTLRGAGREVELGAFLSPDERVLLAAEVESALTRAFRA